MQKINFFLISDGMNHLSLPPHPHLSLQRKLKLKQLFPSSKWKFRAEPEIKPGLPHASHASAGAAETNRNSTDQSLLIYFFFRPSAQAYVGVRKTLRGNSFPDNLHPQFLLAQASFHSLHSLPHLLPSAMAQQCREPLCSSVEDELL